MSAPLPGIFPVWSRGRRDSQQPVRKSSSERQRMFNTHNIRSWTNMIIRRLPVSVTIHSSNLTSEDPITTLVSRRAANSPAIQGPATAAKGTFLMP